VATAAATGTKVGGASSTSEILSASSFLKTEARLDGALDGPVWLRDPRVAAMVMDALRFGESDLKLYRLSACVVMPNHVHVLWTPRVPLERITRRLKGYTSLHANRILDRAGQRFWQEESFDHWVRNEHQFDQIADYIENNPVKARLVSKPEDWPWSSATR
jgi:putative transposase